MSRQKVITDKNVKNVRKVKMNKKIIAKITNESVMNVTINAGTVNEYKMVFSKDALVSDVKMLTERLDVLNVKYIISY